MLDNKLKNNEQEYEITVYDDKTVEENGGLDNSHSKLEKLYRKIAKDFKDKYNGRLNIRVIIR